VPGADFDFLNTVTEEAAPLVAVFGGWAPWTSKSRSLITSKALGRDRDFQCPSGCIATTAPDICISSPPVAISGERGAVLVNETQNAELHVREIA
jgi:hypothetical protein